MASFELSLLPHGLGFAAKPRVGRGERIRTSDLLVPKIGPVYQVVDSLSSVLRRFAVCSLVFGTIWTQVGPKF